MYHVSTIATPKSDKQRRRIFQQWLGLSLELSSDAACSHLSVHLCMRDIQGPGKHNSVEKPNWSQKEHLEKSGPNPWALVKLDLVSVGNFYPSVMWALRP